MKYPDFIFPYEIKIDIFKFLRMKFEQKAIVFKNKLPKIPSVC